MSIMLTLIINTWDAAIGSLSVCAIIWSLERLFPRYKVSAESQLRSVRFWLITALATGAAVTILQQLHRYLHPHPLFVIPLNRWLAPPSIHWLIYIVPPFLGLILYDFFDYWMHRAEHKWLWAQHAVHHSITELSGVNSYFHWTEPFMRLLFIRIPAAYIVGIDSVPGFFVFVLFDLAQGNYLHSPTRLHYGPVVRRIMADNRFHRIHHSRDPRHFDKNFGAGTSIWDQLFGTAYFPAADEWPEAGLTDQPEPVTLSEYLWRPFRRRTANTNAGDEVYVGA